eukprot:6185179-Pleurochrysis_carterae.AAC.3
MTSARTSRAGRLWPRYRVLEEMSALGYLFPVLYYQYYLVSKIPERAAVANFISASTLPSCFSYTWDVTVHTHSRPARRATLALPVEEAHLLVHLFWCSSGGLVLLRAPAERSNTDGRDFMV